MSLTIDMLSPERAWEPFVDWCRDNGIDPSDCQSVAIEHEMTDDLGGWWVTATFLAFDRDGKHAVDTINHRICTYERSGRVLAYPPLHPDRQAVSS